MERSPILLLPLLPPPPSSRCPTEWIAPKDPLLSDRCTSIRIAPKDPLLFLREHALLKRVSGRRGCRRCRAGRRRWSPP